MKFPAFLEKLDTRRDTVVTDLWRVWAAKPPSGLAAALRAAARAHPSTTVQKWALASLGELRIPGSLPILHKALSHERMTIRQQALRSLGKIGSRTSLPFLRRALRDESAGIRNNAVAILGRLGDGAIRVALRDEAAHVRKLAARLLESERRG